MKFCEIGMKRFISAWNCHHLPLPSSIPNLLQSRCNRTTAMHQHEIPSAEQATDDYRQQGGNISQTLIPMDLTLWKPRSYFFIEGMSSMQNE